MSKPAESISIQVDCQGLVADHKDVNSQVKLFTANQKWVHDVSLDHIRFCLWALWLPSKLILPLSDVLQLVKQKDALALRLANRLHDPHLTRSLELLYEQAVVSRQVVGGREEVVAVRFQLLAFSLQLLLVSLEVFDHEILSG